MKKERKTLIRLLRFLRSQKFDLAKTKKVLVRYLRMRVESPEWFMNLDPTTENFQELVSVNSARTLYAKVVEESLLSLSNLPRPVFGALISADILRLKEFFKAKVCLLTPEQNVRRINQLFSL